MKSKKSGISIIIILIIVLLVALIASVSAYFIISNINEKAKVDETKKKVIEDFNNNDSDKKEEKIKKEEEEANEIGAVVKSEEQIKEENGEYSEDYKKYKDLSEEEKKNYEVIPRKFDVEYEKIYDIIKKQEEADKKEENNKEDEVENNKKQEENTNDDTDDKKEDNKEDNKKDNKEEDKDLIPTYYNLYDKIDIPVRNQYSFGLCWCFASLKSIETNLALTKGKYYDLSEIYIDYMLSNEFSNNTTRQKHDGGSFSEVAVYTKNFRWICTGK